MGVSIPVGSLPTGRKSLALSLALTEDKVRTSLNHLLKTGEITQQKYSKFSVITIVNWESYQEEPQQVPSKSPASPQQVPTLKEGKKERKEEVYRMPFDDFPSEWRVWSIDKTSLSYDRMIDEWGAFKEYWTIGKGKNTKRSDWFRTWRKWCEKYLKKENGAKTGFGRAGLCT
jgi:hypothetical protein